MIRSKNQLKASSELKFTENWSIAVTRIRLIRAQPYTCKQWMSGREDDGLEAALFLTANFGIY